MKPIRILVILLVLALLAAGAFYYLTCVRPDLPADVLLRWGDRAMEKENADRAIRLYGLASSLRPTSVDAALRLAEAYEAAGNYTKTEYTLSNAIQNDPTELSLYTALCGVYVRQNKLMDAVELLSSVTDHDLREQLAALRPASPVISPESGIYTEEIEISIGSAVTVYYSLDEEYPDTDTEPYSSPICLTSGTASVTAVAVGENGLVSEPAAAAYTVGGIVREVTFTDPAIEALVREKLDRPEGAILSDEVWAITALTIPEGVISLADLALFETLETLTISDLSGVDLSPVARLTALRFLTVTGSHITENGLEAIGSLSNLEELTLSDCSLTTLAPLSGLTGLRKLDVSHNAIGNTEPLATLTGLLELDLSHNALTDPSTLAELTSLSVLDLSGNPLEQLPTLSQTVTELYLSDCSLDDADSLAFLADLPALRILDCSDNDLEDLSVLAQCRNLISLDCSGNRLTELDCLAELPRLATLHAGENALTALPDFPQSSILTDLDVPYNKIEDISVLDGLQKLNYVNLDYNAVSDLSPLRRCVALVQVSAYGCPVSVAQAAALTEVGIIVHYSPDYTAAVEDTAETEPDEAAPVEILIGREASADSAADAAAESVPDQMETEQEQDGAADPYEEALSQAPAA